MADLIKIDLTKTSDEHMFMVLSDETKKNVTKDDVKIISVKTVTGRLDGTNAEIEMAAQSASALFKPGKNVVRYVIRRAIIGLLKDPKALEIDDNIDNYLDDDYVLAKTNELLGTIFNKGDIEYKIENHVEQEDGRLHDTADIVVTLKDGAHSAMFGSITIKVTDTEDRRPTLDEVLVNDALNGFDYPDQPESVLPVSLEEAFPDKELPAFTLE